MKKNVLSIKELEKIFRCKGGIIALCIIIIAPCIFLAISLSFAKGSFNVLMTVLFMSIFFWVFCFNGIKDLIGTFNLWKKIKNKRFSFYVRRIRDIKMLSDVSSSNDYNHHIHLNDGSKIIVSDGQGRKLSVGSPCYVIYFEGDKEPSAIFDMQYYTLDNELLALLKTN